MKIKGQNRSMRARRTESECGCSSSSWAVLHHFRILCWLKNRIRCRTWGSGGQHLFCVGLAACPCQRMIDQGDHAVAGVAIRWIDGPCIGIRAGSAAPTLSIALATLTDRDAFASGDAGRWQARGQGITYKEELTGSPC